MDFFLKLKFFLNNFPPKGEGGGLASVENSTKFITIFIETFPKQQPRTTKTQWHHHHTMTPPHNFSFQQVLFLNTGSGFKICCGQRSNWMNGTYGTNYWSQFALVPDLHINSNSENNLFVEKLWFSHTVQFISIALLKALTAMLYAP